MGNRGEKGKHSAKRNTGKDPRSNPKHKKPRKRFKGTKILLISLVVLMGGATYWYFSSQSAQQSAKPYPQTAAGIFFSNPVVASNGTKVSIPSGFVDDNKLVFLDLKLESQASTLRYEGRTIPLGWYRDGKYLPLIVISTPSQRVISGIRVCEPCGSFSFHIVQGKYLDCDACHTRWDIETLRGVSGSCSNYPPPKLASSVDRNLEIDLSTLGIRVTS